MSVRATLTTLFMSLLCCVLWLTGIHRGSHSTHLVIKLLSIEDFCQFWEIYLG
jgi:hypothetical protein